MNSKGLSLNNTTVQTAITLGSNLLTVAISIVVNFFLAPYIVETLGTEANGFTQLANNFIMYANLITLALNSMAGRFVSMAYHRNDMKKANIYYSSAIIGNIIIFVVLVLPAIFCVYNLERIINIENSVVEVKILFSFVFINFFVGQLFSAFSVATYVKNKLYIPNMLNMLKALLNAVILVVLFSLFAPRMYFVSFTAALLTVLYTIAMIRVKSSLLQEVKFRFSNFSVTHIKELIFSGAWNTMTQAGHIFMFGVDLLLANLLLGPLQMGILSVSKIFSDQIINLGTIVNNSFGPSITTAYAKSNDDEVLKRTRMAMKVSSMLMILPIAVFTVFCMEFYKLWVPTLDSNQLMILAFLTLCAYIPLSGTQALYTLFTSTNRLKFNSLTYFFGGILTVLIVLLLLATTDLGVYAIAGVSSGISIIRSLFLVLPYAAKILGLKWYAFYKDVGISILCSLMCFVVAYAVKMVVFPSDWLMLIVGVGISCVLCFVIEMLVILDKQERRIVLSKVLRRKKSD